MSIIHAQIPTSGLKAYYELDNASTTDFLGLNNLVQTGTSTTVTTNRFGSANSAITLNGDNFSRGNITYSSSFNDFSISFWLKTTTNTGDYKTIIYDINNPSGYAGSSITVGSHAFLRDGKISFRLRYALGSNTGIQTTVQSEFIADGNWHHITVVSDQLKATIYTDNTLTAQGTNNNAPSYTNRLADPDGSIFIAQNSTESLATINQYQDDLDDVIFYDKALTVTEIEGIGNNNGFCFPPIDTDLSATNVTETSADINWINSGTYDIAYGLSSDDFTTYTQVNGITAGSYTLTNLVASSTYIVYIRQQCSATQNSDWNTLNFATDGPAYVDINATGNNTGSSFTNAYTDLNTALANHPGKEIWIAAGTYIPTQSGTTDRGYSFDIPANTKLYGGFDGTETMLSERDSKTNITILSGDINGDHDGVLVHENPLYSDNSYQIVTITEDNVMLDGLTIKGGNANGTIVNGAALAFNESVVTLNVTDVVFEDNRVAQAGIIYATNNGVSDSFAHNFNFESCVIRNNIGQHSTAMYIVNPYTINTLTTNISNTLIYGNEVRDTSTTSGVNSLLWFRNDISRSNIAYFYNCTITKNRFYGTNTQDAGVITSSRANIANGQSQVYLYNSIVWDNLVLGLSEQVSVDKWGTLAAPGSVQVKNSIGADNFSNWSPTDSANANPLFTDATNNDFTLQATSPAVDSGDNSLTIKVIDLAGNNRIFNTTVDMGVYEFGSSPPLQRTLGLTALNGTITVDIEPTAGTYNDNTEVTLTAVPDSGYEFNGWSGDANQTAISTKVTMDADKNVTALFRLIETPSPCSGTVVIPDTLFKSILVNNASINTNGDSEISCSEAAAYTGDITSFGNSLSTGKITDLTGIEAFINVTKIDLPDHNISIMDLSNNKELTYLRVSNNNLRVLDVSENRLLTTLLCYLNSSLEFLNVANFNNTNFVAFEAQLNPSLNCIQVDDVTYSTTNWASKDAGASFSHDCMYTFTQSLTTIATNGTISVNVPPTNGVYNRGDIIELTATPATGYQFDGWSGDASGTTNPLSVTMDADKNITAIFSQIRTVLTYSGTNGTLAPDVQPTNGTYAYGTIVEIDVFPDTGYQFDGWSGDASGTDNPLSITMDADKNVVASFSLIQQTLTTTAANGTITVDIVATNGTYDYGTVVELNATPDAGYQFDGWSGDISGTTNPISITMDADKSVTPLFSLEATASIVDNEFDKAIAIYPNPLEDIMNISLSTNDVLKSVSVFNVLGKKLLSTSEDSINVSELPSGFYLVKIENRDGEISLRKIVKK